MPYTGALVPITPLLIVWVLHLQDGWPALESSLLEAHVMMIHLSILFFLGPFLDFFWSPFVGSRFQFRITPLNQMIWALLFILDRVSIITLIESLVGVLVHTCAAQPCVVFLLWCSSLYFAGTSLYRSCVICSQLSNHQCKTGFELDYRPYGSVVIKAHWRNPNVPIAHETDVAPKCLGITLGEHLRSNCVQKYFYEAFKYQKYTKFIKICPKLTDSNICCIGRIILEQRRW